MKKVYLAGAVDGRSDSVVYDWRHTVVTLLKSVGLEGVLPPGLGGHEGDAEKVVVGDLAAVRDCDATLCNASLPSTGTGAELLHAHMTGKLIVAYASPGPYQSIFVKYFARPVVYPTLEEAVARLAELLAEK